jgi:hypothetical protein
MSLHVSRWSKGLAEWIEGETAFLSIAFTWQLDSAFARALALRAIGYKVRAGGPALFLTKMRHELASLEGVEVGGDYPDAIARHNPLATVASRGCPGEGTEDDPKPCPWCIVPPMEGTRFTLIPDFPVRPVLCDNNLSALPAHYQDFIIGRYQAEGVALIDANSGFEPRTFTTEVYERWKPLLNAGGGPWRFAYDRRGERDSVMRVMRMLSGERSRRKRVYVLIGNEPFDDCLQRIQEVIDHGCEPHVQPEIKLGQPRPSTLGERHPRMGEGSGAPRHSTDGAAQVADAGRAAAAQRGALGERLCLEEGTVRPVRPVDARGPSAHGLRPAARPLR